MDLVHYKYAVLAQTGRLARRMGVQHQTPVFVIGSGRCGTSLLTQILDAHANLVHFPTEANELWHPNSYPAESAAITSPTAIEDIETFCRKSLASWPSGHGQRIRDTFFGFHLLRGRGKQLIVKSAMITFLIDEILALYPDAKFVHIYRNGVSVAHSWFKKKYQTFADKFAEQEFVGLAASYWNANIHEIDRKAKQLGLLESGRLFELSYEDLCAAPIDQIRALIDFIGRDFEDFNYDFDQIKSTNYKVGHFNDEKHANIMQLMSTGMALKGYLDQQ